MEKNVFQKIDINNFGNYSNFVWKDEVRDYPGNNIVEFKKLNIIYGRNYSGKTTLSRIFRSLEKKQLPSRFENPSFTIKTTSSGNISQNSISTHDYDVRVYNKDFLDEHLSFLKDETGHIKPFAILGGENTLIEASIKEIENFLGDAELKTGLRYEYKKNEDKYQELKTKQENLKKELDQLLFDKANNSKTGIKYNTQYNLPTYDTKKLNQDIKEAKTLGIEILDENSRLNLLSSIKADALLPILFLHPRFQDTQAIVSAANKLLAKEIKPTQAIQELLSNDLLQNWVRTGYSLHKDIRQTCGFCGNLLSESTLDRIDSHFSKESKMLEDEVNRLISSIDDYIKTISIISLPNPIKFYTQFQKIFSDLSEELIKQRDLQIKNLTFIKNILGKKLENIFLKVDPVYIDSNDELIERLVGDVSSIINSHNKICNAPKPDSTTILKNLRLSEVAKFVNDIDYEKKVDCINSAEKETIDQRNYLDKLKSERDGKLKDIDRLRTQLLDERKGAEKVNEYLCHSLSGGKLKLEAVEIDGQNTYKFKITRDNVEAFNLSEGECSLIAFCYYLAKLNEASSVVRKKILYIDDPISSLDSNHIFFIYSLIEKYLAQSIKDSDNNDINICEQMFISTHNLEFLKYLKKISSPKTGGKESFVITRRGQGNSYIKVMPKYLRNYITELNYLFGEIFTCSKSENFLKEHHSFYNFGNNLRKFLEAYLFFKYPSDTDSRNFDRVSEFFKDETSSEVHVQRLINEYSHVGEFLDRSSQPIDSDEITTLANFVLKKMRENDPVQFSHFVKSIGQTDPFAVQ